MGDNLKAVVVKFSTLSLAVFVVIVIIFYRQVHPHLELETKPRFCPVGLSLTMHSLPTDHTVIVLPLVPWVCTNSQQARCFYTASTFKC